MYNMGLYIFPIPRLLSENHQFSIGAETILGYNAFIPSFDWLSTSDNPAKRFLAISLPTLG